MSDSPRKIRILHSVGHLLRGGIETWLYQVVRSLDPALFSHHILVRTEAEEPFTQAFRDAGALVLPCTGIGNPLRYAANFRRTVREHGPYDVLHVHGSNPNGLMALALARSAGIPMRIVHSHNDVRPLLAGRGHAYKLYVETTLALYRRLSDIGLAASNRAAESMFGPAWARDPRRRILYCGVDFAPYRQAPPPGLRHRLGIPQDAWVLGHVGRFHEQKNHAFLLEIAESAVRRNPRVRLLLIGDGPLRTQILDGIGARGLTGKVIHIPDTLDVPQYITGVMNCLVFPSRYEGLGLVAVEAQAAGLPVILSEHVPEEAVILPDLVRILPLAAGADAWADASLAPRPASDPRDPGHIAALESSRFSPQATLAQLQSLYRSLPGAAPGSYGPAPFDPIQISQKIGIRAE